MRPCIYEVTKHFFHKDFIITLRISKIFIPTVHSNVGAYYLIAFHTQCNITSYLIT